MTHGWVLRAPGLGRNPILLILGWTQGDQWGLDPGAGLAHRLQLGAHSRTPLPGPRSLSLTSPGLTPTPDIHIQGTLESGHPKNITCTVSWDCGRETPPVFSWMWANFTLGLRTANSSVLTFTPGPQDHGTNLTCQVALRGGLIRERTIQLNVTCEYPVRTPVPAGGGSWGLGMQTWDAEEGRRTPNFTPFLCIKFLGGKGQCPPFCH